MGKTATTRWLTSLVLVHLAVTSHARAQYWSGNGTDIWNAYGHVGIALGTPNTAPISNLDIRTGYNIDDGTNFQDGKGGIRIWGTSSATGLLIDRNQIEQMNGADALYLNQTSTAKTVINYGGGNVGIGTASPAAKLHVAGTTRTSVLEISGGSDLAEPFVVNEPSAVSSQPSSRTEQADKQGSPAHHSSLVTHDSQAVRPGMVVVIDPKRPGELKLASEAYDRKVAGVVSGAKGLKPGMVMRAEGRPEVAGQQPVALTGRVWCWCDASYGSIEPGDLLTTSVTPGHAMKVTAYEQANGAILGKAMSRLTEGKGLVLVLVALQ